MENGKINKLNELEKELLEIRADEVMKSKTIGEFEITFEKLTRAKKLILKNFKQRGSVGIPQYKENKEEKSTVRKIRLD